MPRFHQPIIPRVRNAVFDDVDLPSVCVVILVVNVSEIVGHFMGNYGTPSARRVIPAIQVVRVQANLELPLNCERIRIVMEYDFCDTDICPTVYTYSPRETHAA